MCIKDGKFICRISGIVMNNGPKYGETVTASQSPCYPESYFIHEYPIGDNGVEQYFNKICFIPLSSIDETEMVREYNKQTV